MIWLAVLLGLGVTIFGATSTAALITVSRADLAQAVSRRLKGAHESLDWLSDAERELGVATATTGLGIALLAAGLSGAVDGITGVLARELGPKKIRVNALNPGMVETEGFHAAGFHGSDFEAGAIKQTPLGRIGQPTDIANIAVFLASDDSAWLTGEQLLAGGGMR